MNLNSKNLNAGFEWKGSSTVVHFVHGWTGCPHDWRYLAETVHAAGYSVFCEPLAGHGTDPMDMEEIHSTQWIDQVNAQTKLLDQQYERRIMVAQSMGAALSAISSKGSQAAGYVFMSPALILKDWRMNLAPFLKQFVKLVKKSRRRRTFSDIPESDLQGYDSYPLCTVEEMLKVSFLGREALQHISTPLLHFHSLRDPQVPYDANVQLVRNRVRSTWKKFVPVFQSYHLISLDGDRELVGNEILQHVERCLK